MKARNIQWLFTLLMGLIFLAGCRYPGIARGTSPESNETRVAVSFDVNLTQEAQETEMARLPQNPQLITPTPTATGSVTPTPTPTRDPCLRLIQPLHLESLPAVGEQAFRWENVAGTASYRLEIQTPDGAGLKYDSIEPEVQIDMARLPWGGEYRWRVLRLDKEGEVLCSSGEIRFEKPQGEIIKFTPGALTPIPTLTLEAPWSPSITPTADKKEPREREIPPPEPEIPEPQIPPGRGWPWTP